MLILGIETSCDETAAAVVRDGRVVLSSVVASQHDIHAKYGGVVPELASRAHAHHLLPVISRALEDSNTTIEAIDAIAVGHRPGLIGALLVGVAAAKALAWSIQRPIVGVDHVHAHLYAGTLVTPGGTPSPQHAESPVVDFPALGLVVSGGHTSIYRLESWTELTRLGATIDDAMGEAFDKAATILGLPYPGGPNLDRLAQTPHANERAFDFPIARISPSSLDVSFSGLKTSMLYAVRGTPLPGGRFPRDHTHLTPTAAADLAASFQRAAVAAAIMKLERTMTTFTPRTIVAGGGVTANSRLRRELQGLAIRRRVPLIIPPMSLCVDNAAMIAGLAFERIRRGLVDDLTLQAEPTVTS